MNKLTVFIAMYIALFGRGTHGLDLCVGDVTGNAGFCIDSLVQAQVDLCDDSDFTVEEDVGEDCPLATVR
jgi:hypothetical protein